MSVFCTLLAFVTPLLVLFSALSLDDDPDVVGLDVETTETLEVFLVIVGDELPAVVVVDDDDAVGLRLSALLLAVEVMLDAVRQDELEVMMVELTELLLLARSGVDEVVIVG